MSADLTDGAHWELNVRRSISRLFLLSTLAERPMHGYEWSRAVARASGECCAPSDAALYPAIRELEAGGYIACEVETHGGRRRNVCSLTTRGEAALTAGAAAWGAVLPYLETIVKGAGVPVACCEPPSSGALDTAPLQMATTRAGRESDAADG